MSGNGHKHAKPVVWFGYIVTEETLGGVQTTPTPSQQRRIDRYRDRYTHALGFAPHGLHYLPELGAVWLPPEESDEDATDGSRNS